MLSFRGNVADQKQRWAKRAVHSVPKHTRFSESSSALCKVPSVGPGSALSMTFGVHRDLQMTPLEIFFLFCFHSIKRHSKQSSVLL